MRRSAAGSARQSTHAEGVAVRSTSYAGVPCVVCEPSRSARTLLYFHGGGYRLGSPEASTPFATRLASATASTVVLVGYRLAPEHPFPAGLHDAAAVYGELLDTGAEHVVVAGDSAGGGLAAALVVAASDSGLPLPDALVLMSAWLDLCCNGETFVSRAGTDELFSLGAAREASEMYLQDHDATDPLASPLQARLGRWPRAMVLASTDEVLLEDSVAFASMLALAGVPVVARFESGVPHAWPSVFPDLPESRVALDAVGEFLGKGG